MFKCKTLAVAAAVATVTSFAVADQAEARGYSTTGKTHDGGNIANSIARNDAFNGTLDKPYWGNKVTYWYMLSPQPYEDTTMASNEHADDRKHYRNERADRTDRRTSYRN